MADGFRDEGIGTCTSRGKQETEIVDCAGEAQDVFVDVKPVMGERNEAFFTHKNSEKLCSPFGSSAVHRDGEVCVKQEKPQRELSMELESVCEEGEDNCRKKRCADRYDSSESSDSGVAVNGCSDYSSSSGNSDITDTDPGSPLSVSSEDSSRTTPTHFNKMPAVVPMWSSESEAEEPEFLPAAPTTASKKRSIDNNNTISSKKLKVECVSTVPFNVQCLPNKKECFFKTEDATDSGAGQQIFEPDHRGKITHYYKPKKRPDEKRIPLVKAVTMGFTPFMSTIIANRGSVPNLPTTPSDRATQIIKTEPLSKKILDVKVSSSTFKYPAAFDVNLRKASNGMLMSSELPDVVPKEGLQTKVDPDDKKIIAISAMFKSGTISEKIKSELTITVPPTQPISLCSRLDEKWTGCSESPSSPKPTIEPAVATPVSSEIPSIVCASTPTKPVSNTTPIDRTVSSQSCLGIRQQSNIKETRSGVTMDTVVANVSESVMPEAVISTNGLADSVSQLLTVNTSNNSSFLTPAPVGPKSPILSVPKSIRFPARLASKPQSDTQGDESVVSCLWTDCSSRFDCDSTLLEHLHVEHVNTQKTDSFVCHWTGCKVYGRTSCSRSWLERHVLSHGGNKPFRCIVDGCGMRFSSQLMLERHVNWHFKQSESPASNGSAQRRSFDTPPNKLIKRCGKKLRYRRQPWSARQFDYFDAGIMESLQYRLVVQAEHMALDRMPGSNVTLSSKIIAQRVQADGSLSVLLRWFPRNFVGDEWIAKKDYKPTRTIRLTEYPQDPVELSSSGSSSLYSTPPSSPASVSTSGESEDEHSIPAPELWVLEAAAALAVTVVDSQPQQSYKSRRKPLKKAAVT